MDIILKTEWTLPEAGHLILYWLSLIQQFSAYSLLGFQHMIAMTAHAINLPSYKLSMKIQTHNNICKLLYSSSNSFTYAQVKNCRFLYVCNWFLDCSIVKCISPSINLSQSYWTTLIISHTIHDSASCVNTGALFAITFSSKFLIYGIGFIQNIKSKM